MKYGLHPEATHMPHLYCLSANTYQLYEQYGHFIEITKLHLKQLP